MANRKTPAPSNTIGSIDGTTALEDICDEVANLWRRTATKLISVAGTNTITAQCEVTLLVAQAGNQFWFIPAASNTGNVTLNIDGCGAKPLRDPSGAELPNGYLSASRLETVIDMGTEYRCTMPNLNAAAGSTTLRAVLAYQKAAGTNGGTATSGARQRYPLNTVVANTIPGLSLDTVTNIGRMTVPARSFDRIRAMATFFNTNACALFLRNISDAADVPATVGASSFSPGSATVEVRTTFAATKQVELQFSVQTTRATDGLGAALTDPGGSPEMYGFIEFLSVG